MAYIYLLLTIVLTSSLILLFRVFERFKVDVPHAIVVNYFVASSVGLINYEGSLNTAELVAQEWVQVAIVLGLLFISIFNMIAVTTQRMGVSVATVANKMSVIIPVIAAIHLYGDSITVLKVLGIVVALFAVYFTSVKPNGSPGQSFNAKLLLLPLIVFLGSGVIDLLINLAQKQYLEDKPADLFLSTAFIVSGVTGAFMVLYQVAVQKKKFKLKSIVAGVVLGIPNYLSIYFLVKTLNADLFESSVIFPIVNIGIVLFSVTCAFLFFREKLSRLNKVGIALSITAIILIAVASKKTEDKPAAPGLPLGSPAAMNKQE